MGTWRHHPLMILTAAVALAGQGGDACASGFQLREQSAEGMGNAYAGSTAKAYDVSTVFYNPAGMTRLNGTQAGASAAWIMPSSQFDGSNHVGGGEVGGSDGGNHLQGTAVGAAYSMWEPASDWRLGLAITTPFGMRSDYKEDWVGRYFALSSRLTTINASPSIAYRVTPSLSVAAGLQAEWISAELTNAINFGALVPGSGDGLSRVSGTDFALGWTASALYEIDSATRVGLSYRSAVRHAIRGKAEFQGVPTVLAGNVAFANDTAITLPDTATIGIYHDLSPRWAVMSDLSWIRWSVFRTLRVGFDSGRPDAVTPENWTDSWFVSVGANYKASERLTLHMGAAYDMSPVEDRFRTASIPDSDRIWLSGGISYATSFGGQFDLSYAHLFGRTASIDQTDPNGIGGHLTGQYRNHVDLISLSYTMRF